MDTSSEQSVTPYDLFKQLAHSSTLLYRQCLNERREGYNDAIRDVLVFLGQQAKNGGSIPISAVTEYVVKLRNASDTHEELKQQLNGMNQVQELGSGGVPSVNTFTFSVPQVDVQPVNSIVFGQYGNNNNGQFLRPFVQYPEFESVELGKRKYEKSVEMFAGMEVQSKRARRRDGMYE